eukprot:1075649-Amorphochlora_amoeboformis.AAC.1
MVVGEFLPCQVKLPKDLNKKDDDEKQEKIRDIDRHIVDIPFGVDPENQQARDLIYQMLSLYLRVHVCT